VQPPLRRGFNRILLETSIPGAADTKPILDYAADGFSYEFDVPLVNVVTTPVV
jgi:hypothetical protein